jgi:transcriptional regulator GlxA family with amidase domain
MLSPFHFIRTFRQAYQLTPYQYLLEVRLQNAQQMLQSKSLAITEVSHSCGFSDVCAFSKAFKKRFGIAPSRAVK